MAKANKGKRKEPEPEPEPELVTLSSKRLRRIERDAHAGWLQAQMGLSACFFVGKGVPRDLKQSCFWMQKAVSQGTGNMDAEYHLTQIRRITKEQNEGQALTVFKKLAERGHVDSQYELGCCYQGNENEVNRDVEEHLRWLRVAADQGHPKAMKKLAYSEMLEGERDQKFAFSLAYRASKLGTGIDPNYLSYLEAR